MIEIRNVAKNFGNFVALDDVSLKVEPGELLALLGPSGSGKTTLLRIIAGLDFPDGGDILFEGERSTNLTARDRRVGFVFQHFALFRHMTVADNVSFGLRVREQGWRPDRKEIAARVDHLLHMVQLHGLADRYPSQLSGGQRQRVALARALAIEPRVLLLDEPFGALDAKVRKDLRRWLRHLHDDLGITGVFVTHDQEEALEVADRVVVMNQGRIEQVGTPRHIYDHPSTAFVYRFLGNVNSFACKVRDGEVEIGPLRLWSPELGEERGEGIAFVRPHDLAIDPAGEHGLPATVRHAVVLGPMVRVELMAGADASVECEIERDTFERLDLQAGRRIGLVPRQAQVFLADGRQGRAAPPSSTGGGLRMAPERLYSPLRP